MISNEEDFVSELERKLGIVARSGEIVYGAKDVERLLSRRRAKLVLFSRDSPPDLIHEVRVLGQRKNVPMLNSTKTNIELGKLCGRPHPVSTLAVLDFGAATIQQEY